MDASTQEERAEADLQQHLNENPGIMLNEQHRAAQQSVQSMGHAVSATRHYLNSGQRATAAFRNRMMRLKRRFSKMRPLLNEARKLADAAQRKTSPLYGARGMLENFAKQLEAELAADDAIIKETNVTAQQLVDETDALRTQAAAMQDMMRETARRMRPFGMGIRTTFFGAGTEVSAGASRAISSRAASRRQVNTRTVEAAAAVAAENRS